MIDTIDPDKEILFAYNLNYYSPALKKGRLYRI